MKDFITGVIKSVSANESIKDNFLIKLLIENINASLSLKEEEAVILAKLKEALTSINSTLNNAEISNILEQFSKLENTDAVKLNKKFNEVGLSSIILELKKSDCMKDPYFVNLVSVLENNITVQQCPEFSCAHGFVNVFSKYQYDNIVKESIAKVNSYLEKNEASMLIMNSIYEMSKVHTSVYSQVVGKLTSMLLKEEISADLIRMELNSNLPTINSLVNGLKMIEGKNSAELNVGYGNNDTTVYNVIVPTIKVEESAILYFDRKFVRLGTTVEKGERYPSILTEGDHFSMAVMNPEAVKADYPEFYSTCEAFEVLGFTKTSDKLGIESNLSKNTKIKFKVGADSKLELYINEKKMDSPESVKLTETMISDSVELRTKIKTLFNNVDKLANLDFAKELVNERLGKNAVVFEVNKSFYIYEALNTADRKIEKANEVTLHNYILETFKYDVSPIFAVKLKDELQKLKNIEIQKTELTESINKLEVTIEKLNTAISSPKIDESYKSELETLRDQIQASILDFKSEYKDLDLSKKQIA